MSTKMETANAASPVTINPINYTEGARTRMQELYTMRDLIPHFTIPESRQETTRLSAAAAVSPEFVELTATAVSSQNSLVRGDAATPAEIRDYMHYAEAYSPLADELEALAQFVRHSVTAARNAAGSEALTTYALAQRLVKRRRNPELAPYVADMRRALGRVRKAKAETKPTPTKG